MRTLTPLILLPIMVLPPLLMAPRAYAIEVQPRPTVFVAVQANGLVEVRNSEVLASRSLALFAKGTQDLLFGSEVFVAVNTQNPNELAPGGNEIFVDPVRGFLMGAVATFTGAVTHSTDPDLLRTPVAITADASNSAIIFVFGPIPSGRLAGQTFTFSGPGTVTIVCLDCRG